MGNNGLPAALAILVAVVIFSALGFVAWIVATVVSAALAAPAG